MEYRNPVYNSEGGIDCEVNDPVLGWISTTLTPIDTRADYVNLFTEINALNIAVPYDTPVVEPEPTNYKRQFKQERGIALEALTHTFADGSVVQVRPGDIPNFQLAIAMGQAEDWVMEDDSVRLLTVAEMNEAMNSGIVKGKAVWNTYTANLKTLPSET